MVLTHSFISGSKNRMINGMIMVYFKRLASNSFNLRLDNDLDIDGKMNLIENKSSVVGRFKIQSTLVISKSKGPSKTLRDIRISTYQICSIEEKTI